jgi:hypothetical protein
VMRKRPHRLQPVLSAPAHDAKAEAETPTSALSAAIRRMPFALGVRQHRVPLSPNHAVHSQPHSCRTSHSLMS